MQFLSRIQRGVSSCDADICHFSVMSATVLLERRRRIDQRWHLRPRSRSLDVRLQKDNGMETHARRSVAPQIDPVPLTERLSGFGHIGISDEKISFHGFGLWQRGPPGPKK